MANRAQTVSGVVGAKDPVHSLAEESGLTYRTKEPTTFGGLLLLSRQVSAVRPARVPTPCMNEHQIGPFTFLELVRGAGLALMSVTAYCYLRRARPMRIITVIDGDTVMAVNEQGKRFKLRVRGIDCPELGQRNSFEAKEFAESLVLGKWVDVKLYGRDKYKRYVARIRLDGVDLAKELVQRGLAFPLKGSGLGFAALGARVSGKGVWRGFGQAKPWESDSRGSWLLQGLNKSKKFRKARTRRLEERHRQKKK
jgi:micrococcal nuclease